MAEALRIVIMATGEIALPTLRRLIDEPGCELAALVCQPDKPVGRHQELTPPAVKVVAARHGIPVLQPPRVKSAEAVAAIADYAPRLVVVMAYGQIVSRQLLELPPHGCINLHASILPRHRGAAPVHAAVLAGDRESGITAMRMDEGMDTGDILHIERLRLARRETAGSLHDKLAALAPTALAATLDALGHGRLTARPQRHDQASYAPKLTRESGRIDWSLDCHALDRLVRGLHPWPGAFTTMRGDRGERQLKIHSVLPNHRAAGRPGEVIRSSPRGVTVACGRGALLVRRLQPAGGRPMTAAAFASGHSLPPGTILGE